jgi:filamentous hemagglutinin
VVSGKKPRGQWIMRQSDIKGLTPQQIADKFALENVPTGITSIKRPSDANPLMAGLMSKPVI